jgi:hypothetical protein
MRTTEQLKAYPVVKMERRIKILSEGVQEKLKVHSWNAGLRFCSKQG